MQLIFQVAFGFLAASGKLPQWSISPAALIFGGMAVLSVFLIVQEHRRSTRERLATEKPLPSNDLLLRAIWDAIHRHQRIYREISAQYPEQSRYPLSSISWPNWGQPWQHSDAAIFAEATCFDRTRILLNHAWNTLGWPKQQEIFHVDDQCTLVTLLSALEDLDYFLRSKVTVLGIGPAL